MYFYAEQGGTPIPYMGAHRRQLGEYYLPPKLLTAAAMRSYVELLWPLVRFAVSHIAHAALTWHYIIIVIRGAAAPFGRYCSASSELIVTIIVTIN